jgi:Fur family ferric uptake transcriptional regulator
MSRDHTNFATHIRQKGFRMTPQRQIVLDTLAEYGTHATAGEVYESVQAKIPAINRATVYRVLDFLCELQLITRTEIQGDSMYELAGDSPHHHLVCRHCGQVEVLADHHFKELAIHLLAEHGFKAEINHMAISGLCADCIDRES